MRRSLLLMVVTVLLGGLVGCGGDDDGGGDAGEALGSSTTVDLEQVLQSAGDAVAAQGAGLDEPPGMTDREPFDGFGEVAIAVRDADGELLGWCVLLAETASQRARGLMEVTDPELQGYSGMLFVWDRDTSGGFWMRNTRIPLSIAWFDGAGELVGTADMEPCPDEQRDCPSYFPEDETASYRFALEVPQGELDELGITEGSTLQVGGPCATRSDSSWAARGARAPGNVTGGL